MYANSYIIHTHWVSSFKTNDWTIINLNSTNFDIKGNRNLQKKER